MLHYIHIILQWCRGSRFMTPDDMTSDVACNYGRHAAFSVEVRMRVINE